jgi:hypothetical protein
MTFTTNGGTSIFNSCLSGQINISSNTLVGVSGNLSSGAGYFEIVPSTPMTSITISGLADGGGIGCEFCSLTEFVPSPTPTSTTTVTPSITATQTQTPTQSPTIGTTPPPTQTPTSTITPSITSSPTSTPNFLYVYQSCNRIGGGAGTIIQVIQTQPVSFPIEVNETFKDNDANCWYFVGRFDTSYIAPPRVSPINYGGNYFNGVSTQTYSDCVTCATGNIGEFGNSGVSNISVFDACFDAGINPKTLYSNCQTISAGCILYTDSTLITVVNEIYAFHQGANWDLNGFGVVIGLSSTQC